jgi:hypothetical protein
MGIQMIKKTVTVTWSETVTYEKEVEVEEGKEDQWFEAFEEQYKHTNWRNKFVEVEHRQLLSMDPPQKICSKVKREDLHGHWVKRRRIK